jgi:hypothetical protein
MLNLRRANVLGQKAPKDKSPHMGNTSKYRFKNGSIGSEGQQLAEQETHKPTGENVPPHPFWSWHHNVKVLGRKDRGPSEALGRPPALTPLDDALCGAHLSLIRNQLECVRVDLQEQAFHSIMVVHQHALWRTRLSRAQHSRVLQFQSAWACGICRRSV